MHSQILRQSQPLKNIFAALLGTSLLCCQPKSSKIIDGDPSENSKKSPKDCGQNSCENIRIKHCHDGDTCQIFTSRGFWFSIRLAGIDAPEIGRFGARHESPQIFANEARTKLLNILGNSSELTVKQIDLDPFNRPVVEIFAGGDCVNIKLLELGLAERYRGNSKLIDSASYDTAEASAKKLKRGIWSLKDYKSPSAWRRELKSKI